MKNKLVKFFAIGFICFLSIFSISDIKNKHDNSFINLIEFNKGMARGEITVGPLCRVLPIPNACFREGNWFVTGIIIR